MDALLAGAYENSLAQDEVLTGVDVPLPGPSEHTAYLKFQVHERPLLGLALSLKLDDGEIRDARCAVGCVSPTPCRSETAENLIAGATDSLEQRLQDAADALADEASLTDDREGSAEYKHHLIGVLLRRAAKKCLNGGG